MRRVILESPYRGEVAANLAYARRCVRDCLSRGDSPIASHLLLTQVLNDEDAEERELGIAAGLAWVGLADATVAYTDLGISGGMRRGIDEARRLGRPVEFRVLPL